MIVDQSLACFIMDMHTSKLITFNVEKPEGYTDSYRANFQQQDVRGRSDPFQSYINSGPRDVSFSVLVALDYRRDLNVQTDDIRKMMMPFKSGSAGGGSVMPPYVRVKIGNALLMSAIPVSFTAEWKGGYKEGIYRLCTWSFSFTQVTDKSTFNERSTDLNDEAVVPTSLTYILGNTDGIMGGGYSIGDSISIEGGTKIYTSSNDAVNASSSGYSRLTEGDYVVSNIRGTSANISTKDGEDLGWIAI